MSTQAKTPKGKTSKTAEKATREAPIAKKRARKATAKPKTRRKTGRRPVLSQAKINDICSLIAEGNGFEQSVLLSGGVSLTTAYEHLAKGREDIEAGKIETLDARFVMLRDEAEVSNEQFHIANIRAHARDDWKASAWTLERRYPDRYGRRIAAEISGKNGAPIEVEQTAKVVLYIPDNGRDKAE